MTGSFDWWKWLRGRFGGSSTEMKPVDEVPPAPRPNKRRRQPKDDVIVWPDGKEYWYGRTYQDGDWDDWFKFGYHKCKKGEIGGSEPRQKAVWQTEKAADGREHFYASCVECAAVNDFTNHKILNDGKVSPCVVCVKCHKHTWLELEGWTGEERKETKSAEDLAWEAKWKKKDEEWWKEYRKKYPESKDRKSADGLYGSWF